MLPEVASTSTVYEGEGRPSGRSLRSRLLGWQAAGALGREGGCNEPAVLERAALHMKYCLPPQIPSRAPAVGWGQMAHRLGVDEALLLGIHDHRQRNAVLDTAAGSGLLL